MIGSTLVVELRPDLMRLLVIPTSDTKSIVAFIKSKKFHGAG